MERSGTYKALLFLLTICITSLSAAQSFKATVDRDRILIGEQIKLTVVAEGLRSSEISVDNWISFPDTVNHFEVVERGKIDTVQIGGDVILQQAITLTSFDSGQWQIPAIKLTLRKNNTNATATLLTKPITVDVLPVDVSHLQDYHDIKDIIEVENAYSKWILISIIIGTLLSIVIIYFLVKKKSLFVQKAPVLKGKQTALGWALAELEKLREAQYPQKGNVKMHYQRLTDICREFFEMELAEKVSYKTSDEWMLSMQPLPVMPETKTNFFQTIRLADTVKFAKYIPPATEHDRAIEMAKHMLTEVSNTRQPLLTTNKTTKG